MLNSTFTDISKWLNFEEPVLLFDISDKDLPVSFSHRRRFLRVMWILISSTSSSRLLAMWVEQHETEHVNSSEPGLQIKTHKMLFFPKQDSEVSVFELVKILNNVVSHREYIELLHILTRSLFIFHRLKSWSQPCFVTFSQGLISGQMASALRRVALLSACWMYPL